LPDESSVKEIFPRDGVDPKAIFAPHAQQHCIREKLLTPPQSGA